MSHFRKSWGTEPTDDGRWRFRLWAPGLDEAAVSLKGTRHALDKDADGWFETELQASPGDAYAFLVKDLVVPDPAARAQIKSVLGPSRIVDPREHEWRTQWEGRPWEEVVLYELHTGTFSETGDFDGVIQKLDHLAGTGITAVELCPIGQFPGNRGWGYDGVLPYAPHVAYGGPEGLKRLVDAAHERGLMMFLDVVYNHFGPEGNFLPAYAPAFFHEDWHTPWGAGIAFDRDPVRRFFIENALFWLTEYRFDGLRLDAIDSIRDPSKPSFLEELAREVRAADLGRPVHLTTEDERNITWLHPRDDRGRPTLYSAEWNDDFHHVCHVLATGESEGYYGDYSHDPRADMATALQDGFVHQGEPSPWKGGEPRGEPSAHLPPTAFVNFLQNHDQTGNRAFGERLTTLAPSEAVEVLTALLLLSPMIPMLFMGEEFDETRHFQFFTDYDGELADAVREGRRREFQRWAHFADPEVRETIPDPNARSTFEASKLDWAKLDFDPGAKRQKLVRELLTLRETQICPRLPGMTSMQAEAKERGKKGVEACWRLGDGARLRVLANLGGPAFEGEIPGRELFALGERDAQWWIRVSIEEPA